MQSRIKCAGALLLGAGPMGGSGLDGRGGTRTQLQKHEGCTVGAASGAGTCAHGARCPCQCAASGGPRAPLPPAVTVAIMDLADAVWCVIMWSRLTRLLRLLRLLRVTATATGSAAPALRLSLAPPVTSQWVSGSVGTSSSGARGCLVLLLLVADLD